MRHSQSDDKFLAFEDSTLLVKSLSNNFAFYALTILNALPDEILRPLP